ncbi:hypothetical protein [Actinokineospora xionganensis]|uniref:Lipoprotein n=1 Tax=Actinokineospora xionganensis TaxID=2684470 RepID=A0ABR7L863_9PSEU|nr:hypothetical protein [Actinokineospora xionganensis]MBC6448507.1 hypothetical protein [Actinokineospora xionganensis]
MSRALVAAVAAVIGLSGCSGAQEAPPAAGTSDASTAAGTSSPAVTSSGTETPPPPPNGAPVTTTSVPAVPPPGMPRDFPVPPGGKVTDASRDGQLTMVVSGVLPEKALGYYRTSLPPAGYQVVRENTSQLSGDEVVSIDFAGKGYTGTVAIDQGQVDVVVVTMKKG